ncbi:MAG TPA: hypothetical protein VKE40_14575, partial [Gemmataceae bacterium]|nr:hypothetical protein [Gemmataceae bacterium]
KDQQPQPPPAPFPGPPHAPLPPGPPLPPGGRPYQPPPSFPAVVPALLVVALAVWALKRQREQEEEEMTAPTTDPAAGFEYKIVRSATAAFKRPDKFRAMLDEEARAGWELFEVFDHCRVRLRRSVACRERDAELSQDPYRTRFGTPEGKIALWIVLGILVGIAVFVGLMLLLVK